MLELLEKFEREVIPDLIRQPEVWKLKHFVFDKPGFRIQRLYAPVGENTVRLHRFEPYGPRSAAMIHHHVWPMAARLLEGEYEMQVGYTEGNAEPPCLMRLMMQAPMAYEMMDVNIWHSVRPLKQTYTVLIHGPEFPINRGDPNEGGVTYLNRSDERRDELLAEFHRFYPKS